MANFTLVGLSYTWHFPSKDMIIGMETASDSAHLLWATNVVKTTPLAILEIPQEWHLLDFLQFPINIATKSSQEYIYKH